MKYLKLFVTLLTVLTLVATFAYAGSAKKANNGGVSINSVETQTNMGTYSRASLTRPQPFEKDEADVAKFNKSSRNATVNNNVFATSSPQPRRQVTSIDPLAGNYDIPGDFSSLSNAVAVLNYVGVSANVTFTLTAASYTENCDIVFGSYAGNDTYTVTVSPGAGVAATINFLSTATSGKGISFNGAMNVTVDGLNSGGSSLALKYHSASVFPSGDAFGSTIYITGASAYITVANASIEGIVNNAVWADQTSGRSGVFIWAADSDPYENDYITFDGLTITNASYAFKAFTGRYLNNLTGYQITVKNCRVGGAYGNPVAHGGFWEYDAGVTFKNNIFDGINMLQTYWYNGTDEYDISAGFSSSPTTGAYSVLYNSQATATYFIGCDAGVFNDNIWRNVNYTGDAGDGMLVYGIRVSQGNVGLNVPAKAFNNRIYGITSSPGAASILRGVRGTLGQFHHNSVRLEGSVAAGTQSDCISGVTTAYNNAFSNEITGSTYALTAAIAAGGTFANNAMYSTGRMVNSASYPTTAAAISAGQNANGVFGPVNFTSDLHLDPAGPSSAENLGKTNLAYLTDMDGDARDTSAGGTHPDAGADEVALALTATMGPDVLTGVFSAPPAGIPAGVPQAPKVVVRNNSNAAVGAFDVTATVSDGYSEVMNVAGLAAGASSSLTFPNWTPASPGSYTFNATSALSGDVDASNDAAPAYTISVSAPLVITDTTYRWNASDEGWTRSVDWVRSSSFTKLGGPKDGASMVTNRPNLTSTYTEGAYANTQGYSATYPGANILTSAWMDLSTMPAGGEEPLYLSFYQSLIVEGAWDRSWWEYTTNGSTWNHIGVIDDPNGLNWYNTSLYTQAAMDRANFDSATAIQYGLWTTPAPTIFPTWTSNLDNASPAGWVYSQLKMTNADYPTRSPNIRFRFVAFSDAATAPDPGGWAIDNVRFAPTANPLSGAFHGQVFADLDGDGIFNNADTPFGSTKVYLGRFGSYYDSTTTDVSGNYAFATQADLPATYSIKVDLSGYSYTVPASGATTGIAVVNHPADGSDIAVDFGAYVGSVAGMVFNDVNDNATNDTEAGLSGWVVEVRKDLATGTLVGSSTTDVNGAWSMNLPPYATYVAKLVSKTTGRQTLPVSNGTISFAVSGASGGGSAVVTGQEFGVFLYGTITVRDLVDLNGNGFIDGDLTPLPSGVSVVFDLYKNSIKIDSNVTIGNTVPKKEYTGMDAGSYSVVFTSTPSGWLTTNGSLTHNFTISTSGSLDTVLFMSFKLVSISGMAFVDANGDGVNSGDAPAVGRVITITGDNGGSDTTDAGGLFSFLVGPGAHTMSQTLPSGWVGTKPTANAGTFIYTSFSGSVAGQDKSNQDFGSFETYSVSGQVFRDYNNDGLMNGADEGFDGIAVSLTGSSDETTSGGGMFEFTSVGTGSKTLSVTAPDGFEVSFPGSTSYTISGASGTNVSGDDFGLYQTSDGTNKYRTFTLDSLQAWASLKATAFPKTGYAMPNIQVMYNEIFAQAKLAVQATGIMVGKAGVKLDPSNAKSKDKGYLVPSKGSDINATFYKKGKLAAIYQTGTARGIDFLTGNSARILKLNKNLSPDKHSNVLLGNMLALSINIAASDWGKTPAGFGDLIYIGGGTYNNMTVAEIAEAGGELMTSWEGLASSEFTDLNAVVAAINAEFDGPLDTISGWNKTSKLYYTGVSAVSGSSILKAGSGSSPRVHAAQVWEAEPTSFELAQNYPNPFNPSTTISFSLPEDAVVTVKVFNMLGQEVATVVDNSSYFSGTYNETFDAKNLTSGVYFYRVTADITNSETGVVEHMTQTKKMLLTK